MPDLLICGGMEKWFGDRLKGAFTLHPESGDYPADQITHVMTHSGIGLDRAVMDALPSLRMISCLGVGYDAIDVAEAVKRGILVTHTPGVLSEDVATTAVMLFLACYRDFLQDADWARSGRWATDGAPPLSRCPDNRRVGIVGLGRIGEAIARKLMPWQPELCYHNRSRKDVPYRYFDDLTEMAIHVDCLICATPGGAGTEHMINAQVLEALGPEGTLVNIARGSVVDETALIAALQARTLGWAGLDVFEDEPNIPQALRDHDRTVLLPHSASATKETRGAMAKLSIDNLLDHASAGTVRSPVPECANLVA